MFKDIVCSATNEMKRKIAMLSQLLEKMYSVLTFAMISIDQA